MNRCRLHTVRRVGFVLLGAIMMTSVCGADWQATKILQMDAQSVAAEFPAQWQIVTET